MYANEKKFDLVYEAPLAKPVKTMKAVSVTSCVLTSIGMPMGCYLANATASLMGQVLLKNYI
jgi:transmembrane protein 70